MGDGFGIASELDRLLPTERLRDPKTKGVRQDVPHKKREKKGDESVQDEEVREGEGEPAEAPVDAESGKILNILI